MTRLCLFVLVISAACVPTPSAAPRASSPPTATAASAPVSLTYLGVAGFRLDVGEHSLLFDPYVSRLKVPDFEAYVEPDLAAIARFTPAQAEAILISHSHFDHVLDAPAIARRTSAVLLGTESTAVLARAAGVPEGQIRTAHGGENLQLGAFQVRVVPALHSLTGQPDLPISPSPSLPMRASDYHEGGTLQYFVRAGGHAVYFVGTANFVDAAVRDMLPDVAIVAVGLREQVPDYTCRLLQALGFPARVIANHFDAWQEPLVPGDMPLKPDTVKDLEAFVAEVRACAPHTRVEIPVHLEPVSL
jgi:L-ascorbate metabolism protein UlaG (beta-lactamase superfamily)